MMWPAYRTSWDPFSDLRAIQREMNRAFSGYSPGAAAFPALNIWGSGEDAVVVAEVPGVDPKDININVVKDKLTIEGERKAEEPADNVTCHRCERPEGGFTRSIRLPFAVESDKVKAKYNNGLLTVTLPREEATRPKKITIESA